jgi:hypothetical protein
MQTIPDAVLDQIVQHRPHFAALVANLRACPDHAPQIERSIAMAYLSEEIRLSGQDTWFLSQVANGGPWGGDWWTLTRASGETGYDAGTLRRMIFDKKLSGLKYGKTWYLRRDALPIKRPPND